MSKSLTNEQALEQSIERALAGICLEDIAVQGDGVQEMVDYGKHHGYMVGFAKDYNPRYALDEVRFWSFLETTQADELKKLQRSDDWRLRVLERYDRMIKRHGVLRLLKKGLSVDDAHLTLFYQTPVASSGQLIQERFAQNEFSVTRQVQYNEQNRREEIDMVVFINGIAVATMELKNLWTGQNAKVHGVRQYMFDRDNRQPLLQFGRCVVHFAVDTEEVYMCTKLEGEDSFFLPFNKGNNHGKGNPLNPLGHRTAYLWEEVLAKESLANIIEHFVRFDGKATDPLSKKRLFFPRYQQMDVVRKLLRHAESEGVGHTYLIQHSAGSGKSNSITWAAYQLIEVYPEQEGLPGAKGLDEPLFDTVIVVTDRRLLDRQIRDNIRQFSEVAILWRMPERQLSCVSIWSRASGL